MVNLDTLLLRVQKIHDLTEPERKADDGLGESKWDEFSRKKKEISAKIKAIRSVRAHRPGMGARWPRLTRFGRHSGSQGARRVARQGQSARRGIESSDSVANQDRQGGSERAAGHPAQRGQETPRAWHPRRLFRFALTPARRKRRATRPMSYGRVPRLWISCSSTLPSAKIGSGDVRQSARRMTVRT